MCLYHSNWMAYQIKPMPRRSPNWLAIWLVTVVATLPVAGQDASVMMVAHVRPAACHQHDGTAPLPEPVSYRCCQIGHDAAILQSSPASQLDSFELPAPGEWDHILALGTKIQSLRNRTTSSADPPDLIPLRV